MILSPIRVLHTADIQIEVRGVHQRYDEYESILNQLVDAIRSNHIELYIIAGDIFEHWNANDTERALFINHLNKVIQIDSVREVVIIHGNHDINQRIHSNVYKTDGTEVVIPNALDTIVAAMDSNKIKLFGESDWYESEFTGLEYLVWSQKTKHSQNKDNYHPTAKNKWANSTTLTLYHDPVRGTKMWDDSDLRHQEKHPSLADFVTRTVIAGDIHKPQVIKNDEVTFVYCGSPVPRNYGEGDYYENGRLVVNGQSNHPYHIFTLMPVGEIVDSRFVQLIQYRGYHTFTLTPAVNDINSVSWDLINPGTNENLVKVKLPSSTEFWVSKELDIINEIRSANPEVKGITIEFIYGKALVDTETEVEEVSVKDLVSQETIEKIAKNYVDDLVAKSRSIAKEDKEKVTELVNKIFISSITKFKEVASTKTISLKSIRCSNFMAFGDNISIDFESIPGLTKLSGGNGIGKTTLYKFIKWMLSGYVSTSQNKTKKTDNNLLIFNDYRYNIDEVTGELVFTCNETRYTIRRSVVRDWNSGVTDEQKSSSDWKKYIKSATSSLSVESSDQSYYGDAASGFLEQVFGDLEQIQKLCFPDQFTLKQFVNSDTSRMVEEILKFTGMGFFDDMLASYSDLRDNLLSNIAKPSKSIDELNDMLAEVEPEITETEAKIETGKVELENTQIEIEKIESEIKLAQGSINVPNASEAKTKAEERVVAALQNLTARKTDIEQKQSEISELQSKLPELSEAQKTLETATTLHNEAKLRLTELQEQVASKEKDIEILRSNASVHLSKIKEEYSTEISEITDQINGVKSKINELSTEAMELLQQKPNVVDPRVEELKKSISDKETAVADLKQSIQADTHKLSTLKSELETLEHSKSCPTCKREYTEDVLITLKQKISETQSSIADIERDIEKKSSDVVTLERDIESIKKSLADWISSPDSEVSKIERKISEKQEEIKSLNAEAETLERDKQSITPVNIRLDSSPEINEIKAKALGLKSEVADIQETQIPAAETNIKTTESAVTAATDIIDQINKLNEQVRYVKALEQELPTYEQIHATASEELSNLIQKIKEDEEIRRRITDWEGVKADYTSESKANVLRIQELEVSLALLKQKTEDIKSSLASAIKYRTVDSSLKLYKTLIGKNGLPQHIFRIISSHLNHKLNDLLEDLNFRLAFTDQNDLVMIDLSKPNVPHRTMAQLSGMQTCFAGLSLIYVNRQCNNQFIFDWMFIDEVSGQLNSGTDLSYESMNYQHQLSLLLQKFTQVNTMIVDHVIDDLGESNRLEAVPGDDGTRIIM